MSSRASGRTEACSVSDAKIRLRHAVKFLEVASLVAEELATDENDEESAANRNVSASLAILAGIAASDAACCKVLHLRSRGQDHQGAVALVAQLQPDGRAASNALRRLLTTKDTAQYSFLHVSRSDLISVLRQAQVLVDIAKSSMQR